MKGLIVGIVEIVSAVYSGSAKEDNIVTLKFKANVLETHVSSVNVPSVDKILLQAPVIHIVGLHKRKQIPCGSVLSGIYSAYDGVIFF